MRACRGKEEATKERYLWRPQGEQPVPRKKPKHTEPLHISLPQRVRRDCQALAAASQIRRCSIAGRGRVRAPASMRRCQKQGAKSATEISVERNQYSRRNRSTATRQDVCRPVSIFSFKGYARSSNARAQSSTGALADANSATRDEYIGRCDGGKLLRRLALAQFLQPVAKLSLQRRWSIRIERHQIPQGLAAVAAQPGEGRGIGIRMPRHVLPNRSVGVLGQLIQSFCVRARVFADQAQQVIVFLGSLLHQFFEHFRLGVGTQHQPDLFVPGSIDLVELACSRVNKFFQNAALLLHARDRKLRAFEGIQNAKQMLPLAEDNLRSTSARTFFLFFMLHQVGTSHYVSCSRQSPPKFVRGMVPLDTSVDRVRPPSKTHGSCGQCGLCSARFPR